MRQFCASGGLERLLEVFFIGSVVFRWVVLSVKFLLLHRQHTSLRVQWADIVANACSSQFFCVHSRVHTLDFSECKKIKKIIKSVIYVISPSSPI